MRRARITALFFLVVAALVPCRAQILTMKEKNGRTFFCSQTGMISTTHDCGLDGYELVFVGTINQITAGPDHALKLEITPDEIFAGDPGSTVSVMTSECFDNLEVGNRWLFFLPVEKDKPLVLNFYRNPSGPVDHRAQSIETLRQLQHIGRQAILRGSVSRGGHYDNSAVLNARVVATSAHHDFTTVTGAEGDFEFPLLAPGNYKLRAELADGKVVRESVDLPATSCRAVSLRKGPEGKIEGHLRYPDGSPAANINVLMIYNNGGWNSRISDKNGRFAFENLDPGPYQLGFDLTGNASWKNSSGSGGEQYVSLYYPGVTNREDATPIVLTEDQKRNDIDLVLPRNTLITNH